MKASNLIIIALAVTLFVACSKKKDGNSGYGYYQGQYNGMTPNEYRPPGYMPQTMPGYQLTQGCNGPSQMFSDLLSYCGWLARDGERMCNPMSVRQAFMQYCQGFSTSMNYCVAQVRSGCYYGSGCSFGGSARISFSTHPRERDLDDREYSHSHRESRTEAKAEVKTEVKTETKAKVTETKTVAATVPYTPAPAPKIIAQTEVKTCHPNATTDCKTNPKNKSQWICKLPSALPYDEKAYIIMYKDYKSAAEKDCSGASNANVPLVAAPEVKTGSIDFTNDCMNIQEMHEYIIDQKHKLSSASEYYDAEILEKGHSKEFVNAWKASMQKTLNNNYYSIGTSDKNGRYSNLSAIGANLAQKGDKLQTDMQMVENFGKIIECRDKKVMTVKYDNEIGTQLVTYTQNGFEKNDNDFEVTETTRGTFKYLNESGTYLLARYIGVGKGLTEKEIKAKVLKDMKVKGYLEVDPESIINAK
jgi:hypothetical protein